MTTEKLPPIAIVWVGVRTQVPYIPDGGTTTAKKIFVQGYAPIDSQVLLFDGEGPKEFARTYTDIHGIWKFEDLETSIKEYKLKARANGESSRSWTFKVVAPGDS
ncbi:MULTISPECIES: hypothetical protein [unclassified Pseudomonas]|uniref:hypothetical protein n=1 Tax=unclassified Pseudomonas TaxID=196821 RepID=UPI00091F437B|nr:MULTISPECIES: hypothetical protein [unclassified Pseudomonas]MDB6446808.1 hypothetical protein [Pseudomonas sp. 21TX0197]ROO32665.1 hypothetical protein BIV09_02730 [Pseudomonas sp. 7SR1]SFY20158.1 hypothetical protein SAMN03159442_04637 [Pseudomonas sp. NFACC47-1]SFY23901.1 hypothetical protein SAMN03159352_03707 [Pseudomonas sp. NFACC43]SFY32834.1 hypothetical protein SAMN03159390_05006 [Pseudomonas sp. NFACC49-2]